MRSSSVGDVQRSEVAIWSEPGQPVQRGVVKKRGGPKAAVLVQWESGREERVKAGAPSVQYAIDGSRRLQWLLDRNELTSQFRRDPTSVFVDVIRDEGRAIQSAQLKRRVVELGLEKGEIEKAFAESKAALAKNPHIVIKGAAHTWSDVEVDPYEDLRKMVPGEALDLLLNKPRLTRDQKLALGEAIRAGLR